MFDLNCDTDTACIVGGLYKRKYATLYKKKWRKALKPRMVREAMRWMFKKMDKNSNNRYFQFWQQDNYPIELYGYETLKQKLNYLHENPIWAGIVYELWHYKYSSAIDYCTTMMGKIDLELV